MKLSTKIEPGKEFFTISTDGKLTIEMHVCFSIEIYEDRVVVIGTDDYNYNLPICYRYITDIRNALEVAINKIGAYNEQNRN